MKSIITTCSLLAAVACPASFVDADEPAESLPLLTVSANRFGPVFELVTLDISGRNAKLELPDRGEATDPFWSPDGRKLAFRSGRFGPLQACLFDVDRGEVVNLTKTAGNEHQPVWSPDGKRILFTSQRTRNTEIFVMNGDGSNPVNLTNHPGWDSDPSWSPDGELIAFGSSRLGGARLYVMNADGSNVRDLLGRSLAGLVGPSWSADGKQLLYTGPDGNGSLQIFVVNADGKAAEPLTDGPGFNGYAVFSPDGRYVAYVHFDRPIEQAKEGGTLMLYDLETLTHTPINPDGMRCCASSKIVWKPMRGEDGDDAEGQSNTEK
jgi:Tol biopolymer transport system component